MAEQVSKALQAATPTAEELAEEGGYSVHTFRSWRQGKRIPGRENLAGLADLLEVRAARLHQGADTLRAIAGNTPED